MIVKDQEFHATVGKMTAITGRTMAQQLDRMGYFIARGAARNTVKVPKEEILADMAEIVSAMRKDGSTGSGPRAAILVNLKRAAKGKSGLYGAAMAKAVKSFTGARVRSRAFIASGWIAAIKQLAFKVQDKSGAPSIAGIRQFGALKGGGRGATASNPQTRIWNTAGAKTESGQKALDEKGMPALEQAKDEELAKSKAYIERKLAEAWRGAGAKVH